MKQDNTEERQNGAEESHSEEKEVEEDVLQDVREALRTHLGWTCDVPSCLPNTPSNILHFLCQRIVIDGEYGYTYFFLPSLRAAGVDDSIVETWEDLLLAARVPFFQTVEEREGEVVVEPGANTASAGHTTSRRESPSRKGITPLWEEGGKKKVEEVLEEEQRNETMPMATVVGSDGGERIACPTECGTSVTRGVLPSLSFGSIPRELVYLTQLPCAGYCSSGTSSLAEHLKDDAVQWWEVFLFGPFAAEWERSERDASDGREESAVKGSTEGAESREEL